MNIKNRVLSLILSAVMLLSPVSVLAEESDYAFSAGDMTATLISENYDAGEQINVTAVLGAELAEGISSKKAAALASLLGKCRIEASFYDDFGTDRIHAELLLEDTSLAAADMLVMEDGSIQMMTSLTGKYVMTLPAGTLMDGVLDLNAGREFAYADINSEEYDALPLDDRLRIGFDNLSISVMSMLLGWVSKTQMEKGDLYTTDDTYIEATETRDAVAQRMVGKILTGDFIGFLWNVTMTLRDEHYKLQQALAEKLGEFGVTRYQVHQLADRLFTEQEVNPQLDWTQPSTNILDDGTLCTKDDMRYFLVKLQKCIDDLWYETTYNNMSMIVSYDDFGQMVGFDAEVPQICYSLPYVGDFTYSIKTDDNWQRLHTSHGELQLYNDNRVVGDLDIQFGQDVDGVNESHFKGYADLLDQKNATSMGFGVDAALIFSKGTDDFGETELFEGSAVLNLRQNGDDMPAVGASISGQTAENEDGFGIDATAALSVPEMGDVIANVRIERAEYEDIPFAGGIAIDLQNITDEQIETLKSEVMTKAAGLAVSLITKPSALSDLMTLMGE